jgi:hypothetical protein
MFPELLVVGLEGVVLLLVGCDEVFCSFEGVIADGALALEVGDVFVVGRGACGFVNF